MAEKYIVGQKQRTTILVGGTEPTSGYRIWFTIPSTGSYDYVDVIEAKADDMKFVDTQIMKKVKATEDLFNL